MSARQTALKWSDDKKPLQSRGPPELLELVHERFELSAENLEAEPCPIA